MPSPGVDSLPAYNSEEIRLVDTVEDMRKAIPRIVESVENVEEVNRICRDLLESCRGLCNAEVCAVFFVRGKDVLLQAQLGYESPDGVTYPFGQLRKRLRYQIGKLDNNQYDGITGLVASTGEEFSADSWEEIRQNPSHRGKPDTLNIWNEKRPFRGVFAVPLRPNDKTIGVLKVENKRSRGGAQADNFNERDKFLLRTLAQFFARELERAGFRPEKEPPASSLETLASKHDSSNMREVIDKLPRQIEIALKQKLPSIPTGPFEGAIVVGMGGSALPVDVITTAFKDRCRVPVSVIRTYQLPVSDTSKYLIIASSFSGSTEETLAPIEQMDTGAKNLVCVTTTGPSSSLAKLATRRGYPLINIDISREPDNFQPRSAVGYFVAYLTRVLSSAKMIDDSAMKELEAVPEFLRSIDISKKTEDIARWLSENDKIPVIYCDDVYQASIARITKIKFNENAKRPAFFNALPEANHNEMIGFTTPLGRYGILYFHDPASHPRIEQRFEVMKRVFSEGKLNHVEFEKWVLPGDTKIQKIFAALAFAERCSFNLALLAGFDPTPVEMVQRFKTALVDSAGR